MTDELELHNDDSQSVARFALCETENKPNPKPDNKTAILPECGTSLLFVKVTPGTLKNKNAASASADCLPTET